MNSCLYECSVMHHRFTPKVHHFSHAIFMCYLDLDELDLVAQKNFFFSHNRKNLYSFREDDHEPAGNNPLKQRLLAHLSAHGVTLDPAGRVMLLTLPRVLGYIFNPISIYFCFDAHGTPVCSVAEVGNTFREMKLYLLRREDLAAPELFQRVTPKHFYVSPFSPLDLSFDFKFKIPGERLEIQIDDLAGADKTLISTLTGRRAAFTNRNLAWFSLKYPLLTLKVIFLIHWHALRLWLKRLPVYRKAENPALQRDVLRPHASLISK